MKSHNGRYPILYILGAGRSGSTILGILLGASDGYFHPGEISKFFEYQGVPHGWEKQENVNCKSFYEGIYNELSILDTDTVRNMEYHTKFIKTLLDLHSKDLTIKYQKIQIRLIEKLLRKTKEQVVIDSSKFAGRLLALDKIDTFDVKVIYIVRDPVNFLRTVATNGVEQPSMKYGTALIYYFFINLISTIAFHFSKGDKIRIKFEDLLYAPIDTVEKIEAELGLCFSNTKTALRKSTPISVGNIFEGNRIRLKKEIVFQRNEISKGKLRLKDILMAAINIWFYL